MSRRTCIRSVIMHANALTVRMSAHIVPLALADLLIPGESARPVPTASRYWVTDHGRVLSVVDGARALRLVRNPKGYLHVTLFRDPDAPRPARWQPYVHELVTLAFIGPRPTAPGIAFEIDHVDGDKANNHVSNLRYVTKSRNVQLAIAAGRNPTIKLSAAAVWTLRCWAYVSGDEAVVTNAAQKYGVTIRAIRNALAGRTWATVPNPSSRPSAGELAFALCLGSDEDARPFLTLSPFSPDYAEPDKAVVARVLPFRSSAGTKAA